jgi:hypothetical protein
MIWRVAVALTLVASAACFTVGLRNPASLSALAYLYFLLPIAIVLSPLYWRSRRSLVAAALLLTVYCVLPWSFSIGIFFYPAVILMVAASFLPLPHINSASRS